MARPLKVRDFAPETDSFLQEVITGLRKPVREIPSKFLYDERGSRLFDEITRLDEYYPTRTEIMILQRYIGEIVECIGHGSMLIEYGSGSSEKTRILLNHLPDLAAYVPIDISKEHLTRSAQDIAEKYPHLEVLPVAADYNDSSFRLPSSSKTVSHRVVYYPGSTIGNFHPPEAVAFLRRIAFLCGSGGGLLLGVDLKKDPAILHDAYNDRDGVTAEFNLNLLKRINDELDCDFQLDQWRHRAIYNKEAGRIEMHVVSLCKQAVHLNGAVIEFEEGDSIWTESSYKYTVEEFDTIAARGGFEVEKVWTDPEDLFSVQYLTTSMT
ncbi:MAG: L-histidine N(alpha)-methyltransferase [Candidatus Krumholzibacteria bacterium]|nr:L-histidine N(alpha)-methyltransferase [Candidatus Krumholzibacteria bacterium]